MGPITDAIKTMPRGTSGYVIEPSRLGEVYGAAARWTSAQSPVYFYAPNGRGWVKSRYQAADFCRNPRAALRFHLADTIGRAGEELPDVANMSLTQVVGF